MRRPDALLLALLAVPAWFAAPLAHADEEITVDEEPAAKAAGGAPGGDAVAVDEAPAAPAAKGVPADEAVTVDEAGSGAPAADEAPAGAAAAAESAAPAAEEPPAKGAAPAVSTAPAAAAPEEADADALEFGAEAPAEAPVATKSPAPAEAAAAPPGSASPAEASAAPPETAATAAPEEAVAGEEIRAAGATIPAPAEAAAQDETLPPPASAPAAAQEIAPVEELPAPAAAALPADVSLPPAEPELAPSLPAWSTQAQAWAFDSFVRCGLSDREAAGATSRVLSVAEAAQDTAAPGDEVLIAGTHPRGQMFAAYGAAERGCGYAYAGLVMVRKPADHGVCRAVVKRGNNPVAPGDLLYPYDVLRETFLAQRDRAARGGGRRVAATVSCLPDGRDIIASADDVIRLDRGSDHGVVWGELFAVDVPGGEGGRTVGRVIRVESDRSYVRLSRVYQPVRLGDRMSVIAEPPAAPAAKAPSGARRTRTRR